MFYLTQYLHAHVYSETVTGCCNCYFYYIGREQIILWWLLSVIDGKHDPGIKSVKWNVSSERLFDTKFPLCVLKAAVV